MTILAVNSRLALDALGYDVALAEEGLYELSLACEQDLSSVLLKVYAVDTETGTIYFVTQTLGGIAGSTVVVPARFSMPPGIYNIEIISPLSLGTGTGTGTSVNTPVFPLAEQSYRVRILDFALID